MWRSEQKLLIEFEKLLPMFSVKILYGIKSEVFQQFLLASIKITLD